MRDYLHPEVMYAFSCLCRTEVVITRMQVMFAQQSPPPGLLLLLHVFCKSCKTNHCRGCMSPVPCPQVCKGSTEGHACPVEICCTNVRAIAIFEALGGFDRQYLGERETSDERARKSAAAARKNKLSTVGPGGTGYGMGKAGTSYHHGMYHSYGAYDGLPMGGRSGQRGRGRSHGRTSTQSSANNIHSFDNIVAHAFKTITDFLPAPYADSPQIYDLLPHPSLDALLSLSQLPDLLGNLLRNDSITDWIARIDVYHAMLGLLRRLADCELTLEVLLFRFMAYMS